MLALQDISLSRKSEVEAALESGGFMHMNTGHCMPFDLLRGAQMWLHFLYSVTIRRQCIFLRINAVNCELARHNKHQFVTQVARSGL